MLYRDPLLSSYAKPLSNSFDDTEARLEGHTKSRSIPAVRAMLRLVLSISAIAYNNPNNGNILKSMRRLRSDGKPH